MLFVIIAIAVSGHTLQDDQRLSVRAINEVGLRVCLIIWFGIWILLACRRNLVRVYVRNDFKEIDALAC